MEISPLPFHILFGSLPMFSLLNQLEIKEEQRLAAVVSTIDEEVAVVPRGAYVKGPLGDVTVNKSFKGLEET